MNAIVKAVKKYFTRKLGYRMYVQGGIFDGQSHYSMSFEECIDWARCYPNNAQKFIFDRKGQCIAYHWCYVESQV